MKEMLTKAKNWTKEHWKLLAGMTGTAVASVLAVKWYKGLPKPVMLEPTPGLQKFRCEWINDWGDALDVACGRDCLTVGTLAEFAEGLTELPGVQDTSKVEVFMNVFKD